jgi:hypothetical protein
MLLMVQLVEKEGASDAMHQEHKEGLNEGVKEGIKVETKYSFLI